MVEKKCVTRTKRLSFCQPSWGIRTTIVTWNPLYVSTMLLSCHIYFPTLHEPLALLDILRKSFVFFSNGKGIIRQYGSSNCCPIDWSSLLIKIPSESRGKCNALGYFPGIWEIKDTIKTISGHSVSTEGQGMPSFVVICSQFEIHDPVAQKMVAQSSPSNYILLRATSFDKRWIRKIITLVNGSSEKWNTHRSWWRSFREHEWQEDKIDYYGNNIQHLRLNMFLKDFPRKW